MALAGLLRERGGDGSWTGELSPAALATALGSAVLENSSDPSDAAAARAGRQWLVQHANDDGGWGDTPDSPSNLPTTVIVWSALAPALGPDHPAVQRAEAWLRAHLDGDPRNGLAAAITRVYGADRTFAVPILFFAATRGMLGAEAQAWQQVPPLPFALALLPHSFYACVRLHVVSYAMPALIAVGLCRHVRAAAVGQRRPWGRVCEPALLKRLTALQPPSGGFLEAVPLTAFTVLALEGADLGSHPVAQRGRDFLRRARRADGSWPIDTSLRGWLTALTVQACATLPEHPLLRGCDWNATEEWIRRAQLGTPHPFTNARPGGWAWTDDSGGVPDADDTAAGLLALDAFGRLCASDSAQDGGAGNGRTNALAATRGVAWLLGLQNRDGGVPTFCRGWGHLPFDRSAPDLTAHALRAWLTWRDRLPLSLARRTTAASAQAVAYLVKSQDAEGAWTPLWFGSQHRAGGGNPVIGTARVIPALRAAQQVGQQVAGTLARAESFLRHSQAPDGGWGAARGIGPTLEETALAVTALAGGADESRTAALRGADWLAARVSAGDCKPAPLGLYFARLWYSERLYPLIWAVEALGACGR